MALDTNLTPEVVNSYNTYINGNKEIGFTSEISRPTIPYRRFRHWHPRQDFRPEHRPV